MRLVIKGKNMDVADSLQSLTEKKTAKLARYFKEDTQVAMTLSSEKNRYTAEITVPFFDGTFLRTEETSEDHNTAIDAAIKKLERKIRKHRTRLERGLHERAYDVLDAELDEDDGDYEDYMAAQLVRRKTYSAKPMSIEEAQDQMELLGHNFFAFVSAEDNAVNVLYQRKDGNYGLLEPEGL